MTGKPDDLPPPMDALSDDDALRVRFLEILATMPMPEGIDGRLLIETMRKRGPAVMVTVDALVDTAKAWAAETKGRA
jgi:hypothetical protein